MIRSLFISLVHHFSTTLFAVEPSIYERWVNFWNSEDHPNVINIFVSATPWNLMSKESKFEDLEIGYNTVTSKYEMVTQETKRRLLTNRLMLYDLNWSLCHYEEYKKGRKLRLMVS